LDKVPEYGALIVVAFPKPDGESGFSARFFAILPKFIIRSIFPELSPAIHSPRSSVLSYPQSHTFHIMEAYYAI